ncbi:Cytochrome c biogenesis ATP-binding export protein CcmA [bacterium HR40]|nr:Cytochrome c biogenesis ATP-binding export protein CcmA [bacterium HR40]
MSAAEPLFEARGLACIRAGRLVFADLGFALYPGDALVLRGPNGSGKSSLLRLLAGLTPRAAGELRWQGKGVDPTSEAHRARLHFVGHVDGAKAVLTVRENLQAVAALLGGSADLDAALAAFHLVPFADIPVRWLSAGQKRRLALARLALVPRPLWLLDEPAVGLDRRNCARLAELVTGHRQAGGICVVATHGDIELGDAFVLTFPESAA